MWGIQASGQRGSESEQNPSTSRAAGQEAQYAVVSLRNHPKPSQRGREAAFQTRIFSEQHLTNYQEIIGIWFDWPGQWELNSHPRRINKLEKVN